MELTESVEPAEGADGSGLTVNFTSSNIIESVKYSYYDDADNPVVGLENFYINALSRNSVRIVSQPNTVGIKISEIKVVEDYEDESGTFKVTVSGNDYPGVEYSGTTNTSQVVVMTTPSNLTDQMWTFDKGAVNVAAEKTAFSGELHLNVVSSDIITKVKVVSQNEASPASPVEKTGADFGNGTKEIVISYNKAKNVSIEVPRTDSVPATTGVPHTDVIPEGDDAGFVLSANVAGKTDKALIGDQKVQSGITYDIPVTADGDIDITLAAKVNPAYDKKGNLVINVLSQNTVGGKVVSINEVTVSLNNYAVTWKDGVLVKGEYRYDAPSPLETISTNDLTGKDWNGKIIVPFKYAASADIKVTADDGNNTDGTKYAYQVGNDVFYRDGVTPLPEGSKDYTTVNLGKAGSTVELKPVQVSFDPSSTVKVVSGNAIDQVTVEVYDKAGHKVSQVGQKYENPKVEGTADGVVIPATDDSMVYNIEFKDAAYILVKGANYNENTSWATSHIDDFTNRGYVLRVAYNDGKDNIEKTLEVGETTGIKIPVVDGNLPSSITLSAVPNVKVTLSANGTNRPKNEQFSGFGWLDGGEHHGTISSLTSGIYAHFYAESGKIVSINSLKQPTTAKFVFPYVKGDGVTANDALTEWTVGAGTEDRTFYVDFKEFGVDIAKGNNVIKIGKVDGNSSVSIDQVVTGGAVGTDSDTSKDNPLSGNKVFVSDTATNTTAALQVRLKLDGTDATQAKFRKVVFNYYGSDHKTKKTETLMPDTSNLTIDESHLATDKYVLATATLSNNWVREVLLKDGTFSLDVYEYENAQKYPMTLKAKNADSMGKVSFSANDEVFAKDLVPTVTGIAVGGGIAYDTPLTIKAAAAAGYKLVSVNIVEAEKYSYISSKTSENKVTDITDAKVIAEFTGKGYSGTKTSPLKMGKATEITFTAVKDYTLTLGYASGTVDVTTNTKGQYLVSPKRKVNFDYKNGTEYVSKYEYKVFVGSKDITDTLSGDSLKKVGNSIQFDPADKNVVGKTVTVKFYTGAGDAKDETVRTATLVIDKENVGVKFAKDAEEVTLGTTASFKATVVGNPEIKVLVSPDEEVATWDASKKTLTFKTTKDSSTTASKDYTIKLVDKGSDAIVYSTLKVTATTKAVTGAAAPVVKVTGTSNRAVTVSLTSKIDPKIDGLMYKITVKTTKQTKGYFENNKTVYVPITAKSERIDMASATMKTGGNVYDGDPDAQFAVEVWIVQQNTAKADIATSTASGKVDSISPKEGKIFETKLKLSKGTKGNAYTNMGKENPYIINVGYSKNTAVQQLDRVELCSAKGEYLGDTWTANYLTNDDYTITFTPAGKGDNDYKDVTKNLTAGTYTIKAYALEPTSVEVVASIKVKVVQGIVTLDLQNAPFKIYKPAGKAATSEVTAMDTTFTVAPYNKLAEKAKKVEYSIVKAAAGPDKDKEPDFVTNKMITINKNSGKIKIKKDFTVDNTTFFVKAVAKDYATTKCDPVYSKEITVKTTAESNFNLAFYTTKDDFATPAVGAEMNDLGSSYNERDLFGNSGEGDYRYVTYVAMYEKAKDATAAARFVPATFKVSGAKLLGTYVSNVADADGTKLTYAAIAFTKPGTIKITAVASDGSGREFKGKTVKAVTVRSEGTLGYYFRDSSGTMLTNSATNANAGKVVSVNNYSAEGDPIRLYVKGYYQDADTIWRNTYVDHNVSVKNGKLTKFYKNGACDVYTIVPNDQHTFVTLTNKATKAKLVVDVTNYAIGSKKAKTKVTVTGGSNGKGQIYSQLNFSEADGTTPGKLITYDKVSYNKVTYDVTTAKKDTYALVSVVKDDTKKDAETNAIRRALNENAGTGGSLVGTTGNVQVDTNTFAFKLSGTKFSVDYVYADGGYGKANYYINPGTYKISITPAEKTKDNKFIATGKAATVNVPAKIAPKANVKPKANVAFGTNNGTIEKGNYKNYIPDGKVIFTGLLNTNTKGKYNNFQANFQLPNDKDLTYNASGKLVFVGDKSIDPKTNKEEFSGWVTYKFQNLDGTTNTQNIKVNIKATGALKK